MTDSFHESQASFTCTFASLLLQLLLTNQGCQASADADDAKLYQLVSLCLEVVLGQYASYKHHCIYN